MNERSETYNIHKNMEKSRNDKERLLWITIAFKWDKHEGNLMYFAKDNTKPKIKVLKPNNIRILDHKHNTFKISNNFSWCKICGCIIEKKYKNRQIKYSKKLPVRGAAFKDIIADAFPDLYHRQKFVKEMKYGR